MGGHILFETGVRRLGTKEGGFFYRHPGTGKTVRENALLGLLKKYSAGTSGNLRKQRARRRYKS